MCDKETETDGLSVFGLISEFRNNATWALLSQSINYPGDPRSKERREAFNHWDLLPVQCRWNGNSCVCIHCTIQVFLMLWVSLAVWLGWLKQLLYAGISWNGCFWHHHAFKSDSNILTYRLCKGKKKSWLNSLLPICMLPSLSWLLSCVLLMVRSRD